MSVSAHDTEILLVEDESTICQLCRRILSMEGFEVDVATDGGEAKTLLGRKSYRLIIIDLRLPIVDGRRLYQFIAENYPQLTRKVIFTSGEAVTESTRLFLEQNSRPFLAKPFTPNELKTLVKTHSG